MERSNQTSSLRRSAIQPKITVIKNHASIQPQNAQKTLQRTTQLKDVYKPTPVSPKHVIPIISTKSVILSPIDKTNNQKHKNINKPNRKIPPNIEYLSADLTPNQKDIVSKLKNSAQGQYIVILGNGPSLLEVDTNILKKYDSIKLCTINVPDSRCWPTPYWAFYDRSQYHRHKELYHTFNGTLFNSTGIKEHNDNSIKFKHIQGLGYSKDINYGIYVGMSSVFATIQICMFMNFNRIYVVGCDMNQDMDSGQTHFYGVNPDVAPEERKKRFKKEANWYDKMVEALSAEEKNKIIFCSKGINKWPFMNHFTTVEPSQATSFIISDSKNGN